VRFLEPGTQIERYVIEQKLGEGGMAAVYLVTHTGLGTRHALKVLTTGSRQVRDRLILEGRIQGTLRHPGVVTVSDLVDVSGSPGLVMEFIAGPCLSDLLITMSFTVEQVDDIARQLLQAIMAAHDLDLVHRDLKPGNLLFKMMDSSVMVKVADFGIAKVLAGPSAAGATRSGIAMGTPAYMAPEQIVDAATVDHRADLWSLGVVLYELLSGERTFPDDNEVEIFDAVRAGEFTPLEVFCPDLPKRMLDAVAGCLVVDVEARVQSCAELIRIWEADEPAPQSVWSAADLRHLRTMAPVVTPRSFDATAAGTPRPAKRELDTGVQEHRVPSAPAPHPPAKSGGRWAAILGVGVVGLGALALGAVTVVAGAGATWWSMPSQPVVERFLTLEVRNGAFVGGQRVPDGATPMQWYDQTTLDGVIQSIAQHRVVDEQITPVVRDDYIYEDGELIEVQRMTALDKPKRIETHSWEGDGLTVWNLDVDRNPIRGLNFGVIGVRYDVDDRGVGQAVHFINLGGKPMASEEGIWGVRLTYDDQDRLIERVNLGRNGGQMADRNGIVALRLGYHDERFPRVDTRISTHGWGGTPVLNHKGCFQEDNAYDDAGNVSLVSCLDADGEPMYSNIGCHALRWDYYEGAYTNSCVRDGELAISRTGAATTRHEYEDGRTSSMSSYDLDGNPMDAASSGQHRHRVERDRHGLVVGIHSFENAKGERILNGQGIASTRYVRDEYGNHTRREVYGLDGEPAAEGNGVSTRVTAMRPNGQANETSCFDPGGRPAFCTKAWHRRVTDFDRHGRALSATYFGPNGEPAMGSMGEHRSVATVNPEVGRYATRSYFGVDDQPILNADGYATEERTYDDQGRVVVMKYLGIEGEPVVRKGIGASEEAIYSSLGHLLARAVYDEDGRPWSAPGIPHRVEHEYDDKGRRVELRLFDKDGQLITDDGCARVIAEWTDVSLEVRRCLDADGEPFAEDVEEGMSEVSHTAFDVRGKQVGRRLFDHDGDAVVGADGWHEERRELDPYGDPIVMRYFGPDGEPLRRRDFPARITHTRDQGKTAAIAWFDGDDAPMIDPDCKCHRREMAFDRRGKVLSETHIDLKGNPIGSR